MQRNTQASVVRMAALVVLLVVTGVTVKQIEADVTPLVHGSRLQ